MDNDLIFYGFEGLDDALLAESIESLLFSNLHSTGSIRDDNSTAEFPLIPDESQIGLADMKTGPQDADTTLNTCSSNDFIASDQNKGRSSDNYSNITSRNLISERKRRRKLNEKLFSLRSLVPTISKMDKASIVADAITYVQNLHKQVQDIKADICRLQCNRSGQNSSNRVSPTESACMGMDVKLQCNYTKRLRIQSLESDENGRDRHGFNSLEIDVSKVEAKTFFVRISWKRQRGLVTQATRALESVNVAIISANLTTFDSHIVSTLLVEVNKSETMQAEEIKQLILAAASEFGLKKI